MKIPHIIIVSTFAAALVVSTALPFSADAMPAPINKGVTKDANGNLVPNVDTRLENREDAKDAAKDAADAQENAAAAAQQEAEAKAAVGNNTSGSYTTGDTGGDHVVNNTSGGINAKR